MVNNMGDSQDGIGYGHIGQRSLSSVLHREVIGDGLTHAGLIRAFLDDADTWVEDIHTVAVLI